MGTVRVAALDCWYTRVSLMGESVGTLVQDPVAADLDSLLDLPAE
jgi:hypothetical protein